MRAGDATVEVTALAPARLPRRLLPARPARRVPLRRPPRRPRGSPCEAEVRDAAAGGGVELVTAVAARGLALDPLRIGFTDADGRGFVRDIAFWAGEPGSIRDGPAALIGPPVRLEHARGEGERFFGCGERTSGLEKTGSRQVFWNMDPPAGHTASLNNLYTSIPFVLALQRRARARRLPRQHAPAGDRPRQGGSRAGDATRPRAATSSRTCSPGPTPRDVLDALHAAHGPDRAAAAVGARQPPVALGLHGRGRGARDRARVPRPRHPVRRALPRHRPHGRLPRLHLRPRALPRPGAGCCASSREDGFRVVCITDPGVKVDEDFPLYTEGRERGLFCRDGRRRRVPQRRLARAVRVPRLHRTRPRGRGGATSRPPCSTRAWRASGATWTSRRCSSPLQSTMPDDVVHPGGGDAEAARAGAQPLRLADGARRARGDACARGRSAARS